MHKVTLPNLLSVLRVALIPALAWSMLQGRGPLSVVLFAIVIISDLGDGHIARRRQQASAFGTRLDHTCDALCVSLLSALGAYLGLLPWLLSPLIAIAFIQYVVDSRLSVAAGLRPSRLGRSNGIAYFVIVGAAIAVHHYGSASWTHAALRYAGYALCATTVASIIARALALRRARR